MPSYKVLSLSPRKIFHVKEGKEDPYQKLFLKSHIPDIFWSALAVLGSRVWDRTGWGWVSCS